MSDQTYSVKYRTSKGVAAIRGGFFTPKTARHWAKQARDRGARYFILVHPDGTETDIKFEV